MSDFNASRQPRARKPHRCRECERTILAGEVYDLQTGRYDGRMYRLKACLSCAALLTWANTHGPLKHVDWEDREHNILFDFLSLDVLVRGPDWMNDAADIAVAPEWAHALSIHPDTHYPQLAQEHAQ